MPISVISDQLPVLPLPVTSDQLASNSQSGLEHGNIRITACVHQNFTVYEQSAGFW